MSSIFTRNLFLFLLFVSSNAFVSISKLSTRKLSAYASRKPCIAGNWKMNPSTKAEAISLAQEVANAAKSTSANSIVFVPAPFIESVSSVLKDSNVDVGAQDVHYENKGAYTGSISTSMIKSMNCKYVLAGHSERRSLFGDTDIIVNKKVCAILNEPDLHVVLCIGELKDEFDLALTNKICTVQLGKGLAGVTEDQLSRIIIAYEPVWAIGTGLTATPEIANDVHKNIRAWFRNKYSEAAADKMVIQYGGSVTPDTVDQLMDMPHIDGALVGGASLVGPKFSRILQFKTP